MIAFIFLDKTFLAPLLDLVRNQWLFYPLGMTDALCKLLTSTQCVLFLFKTMTSACSLAISLAQLEFWH